MNATTLVPFPPFLIILTEMSMFRKHTPIPLCLTSNLNTMPELALEAHALRKMVGRRLSVCLNTDNRLVSNTNMVKELRMAVNTFGLSPKQLREIVITGFKRSFYHGPYTERREYVRQVMNFYDAVAEKHGVPKA